MVLVTTANADPSLWQRLVQDPNMIVLVRNAESSGNRDGANMLAWDKSGQCQGESLLTTEGRAQARTLGEAFSRRGISPVVVSSPMCRCTETARIAFGSYMTDPGLRQRAITDEEGQADFQSITANLLRDHRGSKPIVFINHRPNIDMLTMELIDIGELVVGTVTEEGDIEVFGVIQLKP